MPSTDLRYNSESLTESTYSFWTCCNTLSKSRCPSYAVNIPVREPRCSSQPPVITAPNNVPATMIVRARAEALGSLSFIPLLGLDGCERTRKRGGECRDHTGKDAGFVAGAIYQLDW